MPDDTSMAHHPHSKAQTHMLASNLIVLDSHLCLNSWLHGDAGDLLDCVSWRGQVYQAFVNAHLKSVPGVSSLTTGRLASGDSQRLGGHAHWTLVLQVLLPRSPNQII